MINIGKGIIAGLVASATIAGAFVLAALTGITQASDPVQAATGIMLTPTGLSWVVHFAVGTFLWGPLLAVLSPVLPSPFWFKGLAFGMFAWLLMLLVTWAVDPGSPPQPDLASVLLHLLFGTVLGGMYGILLDRAERRASTRRAILMGW
jgi:hypothetical protein